MYKKDLAVNNPEWLTWHKTKSIINQHFPDLQNKSLSNRCSLVSYLRYFLKKFLVGVSVLCRGYSQGIHIVEREKAGKIGFFLVRYFHFQLLFVFIFLSICWCLFTNIDHALVEKLTKANPFSKNILIKFFKIYITKSEKNQRKFNIKILSSIIQKWNYLFVIHMSVIKNLRKRFLKSRYHHGVSRAEIPLTLAFHLSLSAIMLGKPSRRYTVSTQSL